MRGGQGQVIGAAERLTLTLVHLKVKDIPGSMSPPPSSPSLVRPRILEGVGLVRTPPPPPATPSPPAPTPSLFWPGVLEEMKV